jgi:hypothetical protein
MAHANILDAILNEPRRGTGSKTANAQLADTFLDMGGTVQTARTAAIQAATGEDSLAEAALKVASQRHKGDLGDIGTAIKWASTTIGISATGGLKIASEKFPSTVLAAVNRLRRVAAKTPAQMKQDGATKLADYSDPDLVPGWAKQVRADLKTLQSFAASHEYAALLGGKKVAAKTASTEEILAERKMSDDEVGDYITGLLNDGITPKDVEQKLKKLAEIQSFNKQFAYDKLKNDAGVVGFSFLEPNHYMENCPATYERMQQKLGGVRAASVKQVVACTGCQHFSKSAGQKRCNLYRLPIVANQSELLPIINNLTSGVKGAAAKKASLVSQHNRETSRPAVETKQASVDAPYVRNTEATSIRTNSTRQAAQKEGSFTAADALKLHNAGQSVRAIYKQASAIVGAAQAKAAVKKFVAGLKGSNTKVALTQIDCTQLQNKLATSNSIVGLAKCASCTYRRGMHCGFTGGTLLAFPGMDKVKTNHRVASGAPTDGHGMLAEFEMSASAKQEDIKYASGQFDVELNSASKVDL